MLWSIVAEYANSPIHTCHQGSNAEHWVQEEWKFKQYFHLQGRMQWLVHQEALWKVKCGRRSEVPTIAMAGIKVCFSTWRPACLCRWLFWWKSEIICDSGSSDDPWHCEFIRLGMAFRSFISTYFVFLYKNQITKPIHQTQICFSINTLPCHVQWNLLV